jgi:hypothetical protein
VAFEAPGVDDTVDNLALSRWDEDALRERLRSPNLPAYLAGAVVAELLQRKMSTGASRALAFRAIAADSPLSVDAIRNRELIYRRLTEEPELARILNTVRSRARSGHFASGLGTAALRLVVRRPTPAARMAAATALAEIERPGLSYPEVVAVVRGVGAPGLKRSKKPADPLLSLRDAAPRLMGELRRMGYDVTAVDAARLRASDWWLLLQEDVAALSRQVARVVRSSGSKQAPGETS